MKGLCGLLSVLIIVAGPTLAGGARPDLAAAAPAAAAGPAPGNVAVLVVDDFGLGADPQAKPGTKDTNCTFSTNDVGSNGAGDDLPPSIPPHGELVYQVLKDGLPAALGVAPVASTTTPRPAPAPPIETMTE